MATADVLILNRAGIDTMTRAGRVLPGSEVTLASSASGTHLAKLLECLGIAAEINAKTKFSPPDGLSGEFLLTWEGRSRHPAEARAVAGLRH